MRYRPTWLACNVAELFLQGQAIYLIDNTVDIKRELITQLSDSLMVSNQPLGTNHGSAFFIDRNACVFQRFQNVCMGVPCGGLTGSLTQSVSKKRQGPLTRDKGVKLSQTAGSGIARIDKGFFATLALLLIQLLKIITSHIDFATNLQNGWRMICAKPKWNGPYCAYILRHIFTNFAISACRRSYQHTLLITQADGQAIKFKLTRILYRRIVW